MNKPAVNRGGLPARDTRSRITISDSMWTTDSDPGARTHSTGLLFLRCWDCSTRCQADIVEINTWHGGDS